MRLAGNGGTGHASRVADNREEINNFADKITIYGFRGDNKEVPKSDERIVTDL
jgi:hypothetical protein